MGDKTSYFHVKYLACLLVLEITAVLILATYRSDIDNWNLSNGLTLFAGIIASIVISIVLLWSTRNNEKKMNQMVNEMSVILKQSEMIRARQEMRTRRKLITTLQKIDDITVLIFSEYTIYDKCEDKNEKDHYKQNINLQCTKLKKLSEQKIDDASETIEAFFSDELLESLQTVSSWCKILPLQTGIPAVKPPFYSKMHGKILEIVENLKDSLSEDGSDADLPPIERNLIDNLQVSTDRSVYPLESQIYVRVIPPHARMGNQIKLEVLNKGKILLAKTIDKESGHLVQHDSNGYQIIFKIGKDSCNTRETYTVRVTHDGSYGSGSFVFAQRTPVIQTDKDVYAIGSDMIITVIDPDSDKDSHAVEYVGNHTNSKLTIISKHDRIETCRLQETGDSTGIFQGVIGILGIPKDSTMIPHHTDAEIVKKTRNIDSDEGHIMVRSGDEITLIYQYGSKTVSLSCHASEFSSSV